MKVKKPSKEDFDEMKEVLIDKCEQWAGMRFCSEQEAREWLWMAKFIKKLKRSAIK